GRKSSPRRSAPAGWSEARACLTVQAHATSAAAGAARRASAAIRGQGGELGPRAKSRRQRYWSPIHSRLPFVSPKPLASLGNLQPSRGAARVAGTLPPGIGDAAKSAAEH